MTTPPEGLVGTVKSMVGHDLQSTVDLQHLQGEGFEAGHHREERRLVGHPDLDRGSRRLGAHRGGEFLRQVVSHRAADLDSCHRLPCLQLHMVEVLHVLHDQACQMQPLQHSQQGRVVGHRPAQELAARQGTIDEALEFFANGVLVHNSIDAARYAITTTEALWHNRIIT